MTRHLKTLAPMAALLAGLTLAAQAPAEGRADVDAVYKLLPADTAFYGSMLRNREQVEIIGKSKAWARLMDLPAVKFARQEIAKKLADTDDPQTGQLAEFLKQPENKELLEVLADAVSDEIFVYGGSSWVDFWYLFQRINQANQIGNIAHAAAQIKGENQGTPQEAQARALLSTLAANVRHVRVPDFVFGFKVKDKNKAEAQLKRLQESLEAFLLLAPQPVKDAYKRVQIGDSNLLTFSVDGSAVPWEDLHIKDYEEKEGQYDALLKRLRQLKLSVSLGLYKNYFVLALGESPDALTAIGGKGKRLSELPEFKPLDRFAGRHFTSLGYSSKALAAAGSSSAQDLGAVVRSLGQIVDAADLKKPLAEKLHSDLKWLAEQGKKETPAAEPGASVGFSFLTDDGTEGYSFNYGTEAGLDASKPLTILELAGGDPIFFGALRLKRPDNKELPEEARLVEVARHVEEAVLSKLDDEHKKKYEEVKKDVLPLLKRLYTITAEQLLPSLDGQIGLVFDAKWKSKHWQKEMPEFPEALPMPEVGLIVGVSDPAKFRKAIADYRVWFNDAAKVAHELSDGHFPDVEVPSPKLAEGEGGEVASFPLPEDWGLDKQVEVTGGLSKQFAVLTLSRGHAERLLKPSGVSFPGGPLEDWKRPLGGAAVFNWPALVDAAAPWIETGLRSANVPPVPPGPDGDVLKQVRTVLDVLRCYKGFTSATYLENGVMVTHSKSVVRDLK